MTIRPSSIQGPFVGTIAGATTAAPVGRSPQGGASASGRPSVDLSAAARQLSRLQEGQNDIDAAKVDALRTAIASGQLKIDTSRIADGLVDSVRELLK